MAMAPKKPGKGKSNLGSTVKLGQAISSVKFKDTKYMLVPQAEKLNKQVQDAQKKMEDARSSKRGLRAANSNPRLSKSAKATRAEAIRLAGARAQEVQDKRIKDFNNRKMTVAESMARDRAQGFGPKKAPGSLKTRAAELKAALSNAELRSMDKDAAKRMKKQAQKPTAAEQKKASLAKMGAALNKKSTPKKPTKFQKAVAKATRGNPSKGGGLRGGVIGGAGNPFGKID